jgi:hypothetical protein
MLNMEKSTEKVTTSLNNTPAMGNDLVAGYIHVLQDGQ